MLDASRLVYCSLLKLHTALDEGHVIHANRQRLASEANLRRLEAAKGLFEASLLDAARTARATEFKEVKVTKEEVLALRDEIVSKGHFPEYEKFVFEHANATEAEILFAIDEVGQATGNYLPDVISSSSIFEEAARSLGIVDIRMELYPSWAQLDSNPCC